MTLPEAWAPVALASDACGPAWWVLLALAALALATAAWRHSPASPVPPKPRPQDSPASTGPTPAQQVWVDARVAMHQQDYLAYHLYLYAMTERPDPKLAAEVLAGVEVLRAAPVLDLRSPDWLWHRQDLEVAVQTACARLGLPVPDTHGSYPTVAASESCYRWSRGEARTRLGLPGKSASDVVHDP